MFWFMFVNSRTTIRLSWVKFGLDINFLVSNSLIDFYVEARCLNNFNKVFSLMHEYNQIYWNSINGVVFDFDSGFDALVEPF